MSWQLASPGRARARPRGRLRLVRARQAARARGRAGGHARGAGRGRPARLRRDPERQADHRHRAVRRLRARRGPGLRGGGDHGAGLEHLPLAGAVDALADGRLGRGRDRRRAATPSSCEGASPAGSLLAAVCGLAGLAFGAWMDLYQLTLAAHQDLDTYLALSATSLPYNLAHAIGNVVFCLLIGPVFIRALRRYRRRMEVRWPAPAAAALRCSLLLVAPARGRRRASPAEPRRALAAPRTERRRRLRRRARRRRRAGSTPAGPGSGWRRPATTRATCKRRGGRSLAAYVQPRRPVGQGHRRGRADRPAADGGRAVAARLRRPRPGRR